MMRWLLLPFFVGYLLHYICRWLCLIFLKKYQALLQLFLACVFITLLAIQSQRILHTPSARTPLPDPLENSRQQLQNTKALLEKQPTHRDLLWNAAILSLEVGDASAAAAFHQRARVIDPTLPPLQ